MKFDKDYFTGQTFTAEELDKYCKAAAHCITVAKKNDDRDVKFHFAYMALIKIGIYFLAKAGYRIKSRPGHHIKIIEALSVLLNDDDIIIIGDKMRKDRNLDFYSSDNMITNKETDEYMAFVEKLYKRML